MADRRWHPWRALRERAHIELRFDPAAEATGGAVYGLVGERAAIVIDPGLDQVERRCALAHELVHDERRITSPAATDATMELEEERVRRATATRLVPLVELYELVRARAAVEGVTAAVVAEEFDVTERVAAEALRQLQALLLTEELLRSPRPLD